MTMNCSRTARLLVLLVGLTLVPASMPAQTSNSQGNQPAAAAGQNSPANPTATQNNAAAPSNSPKNPANAPNNNASNTPSAASNKGAGDGGWGLWGLLGLFGLFGLARGRRTEVSTTRREEVEPPYRKVG